MNAIVYSKVILMIIDKIIANKQDEKCEYNECIYCTQNVCCFSLRHLGCFHNEKCVQNFVNLF
jgi:hypothetical protein